jgi:hypothetical protein
MYSYKANIDAVSRNLATVCVNRAALLFSRYYMHEMKKLLHDIGQGILQMAVMSL